MEVVLRKYGNSTVAVLPPAVLKNLGISAGQSMTLETSSDGKIVLAPKRKYTLASMLAECNPKAPAPVDLALWDAARPAGQEVW
ncbi:MAG: AbrB/MazE/SpoVT family DNA-binding domain-containing protein [Stagnimonas sp.]|nr:AbrB/MazE/SpoVT family DNA-binding domain-containing protein [Stagnimonas sp.]